MNRIGLGLWLCAMLGSAAHAADATVLLSNGFERGLAGWGRVGEAEFAVDTAGAHGGARCARITIEPGVKPAYQQLDWRIGDVREGDVVHASVWMRSRGLTTSPGAYFVLECVDAKGKRQAIAHSQTGPKLGAGGWRELSASAIVPGNTHRLRVGLILHAHGTAWFDDVEVARMGRQEPWPDLGDVTRTITVRADTIVQPRFGGVGFHVFHHVHPIPRDMLEQVVAKRWRELNPSFARVNDKWSWDRAALDKAAAHWLRLKATGTELYVATWGPKQTKPGAERAAYARRVVDNLEYLVREKGCANIKTYCMSNEMTLAQWGSMRHDLPTFRDYHNELFKELARRKLDIGLLATDAAPIRSWGTIEWAAEHMDDITAVYGGHHYISQFHPDSERFYPWFLSELTRAVGWARAKGKPFILGEFGAKQDGRRVDGVKRDVCVYWDTPTEPLVAIQLAEAAIAAVNAGVYAMGNWTFMDFPDTYSKGYINKWGTFKWSGSDLSTRAHYYGFGLLTKFLRGPARVFAVETNDPRMRAAAVEHLGAGTHSIAVVNRNARVVKLAVSLQAGAARPFRKYVYDPANVPQHPFGDLQRPERTVELKDGRIEDTIGAGQLVVYTTAYEDVGPEAVRGLKADASGRLAWAASPAADLCYYRVYRSEQADFTPGPATRIGSTVATTFVDKGAGPDRTHHYAIIAVDQSGNAGAPARVTARRARR